MPTILQNNQILFLWENVPNYAISQINYIKKKNKNLNINLISKYPKNQVCVKKIFKNKIPAVIFIGGWSNSTFMKIAKIGKKYGSKIILMMDNNRKKNFRQFLGKFYFNFFFKNFFDYYWVPGKSSKNLLNYYCISNQLIFKNLYNVDKNIFYNKNIKHRKNFIYCGQFIKRKNIFLIVRIFKKLSSMFKKNKFIIITNSNVTGKYNSKNFIIKKNLSPHQISQELNRSKFFFMLSKEDHWPLAVLEAACAGCFLFLSKNIGSIEDITNNKNSLILRSLQENYVMKKIEELIKKNCNNQKISLNILKKYNHSKFNENFNRILRKCKINI